MSQSDTFSGRVIATKYAIKERIGAGGMGAVYRALHEQTGGEVAVKFLHGTAAFDEHAVKRFQLEAQNAAQLRHANTIRVIDFGVDAGVFYLVMEHLVGAPLSDVIRRDGPMPWRRAVHILRQVLGSLWEAHEHPRIIVHRDIKPANIFVVDLPGMRDHVKVLDFGIARSLAGTGAGTQGFIGTPYYMAPELWRGELVDARTDLYALGCVAFELLAGAPPFQPPPSATEILLPLLGMHCHDDPPSTCAAAPRTPDELGAWVDRLLRKDRAARPPSAREALEELDRIAREADLAEVAAGQPDGFGPSGQESQRAALAPTAAEPLRPGPAVTPPARSWAEAPALVAAEPPVAQVAAVGRRTPRARTAARDGAVEGLPAGPKGPAPGRERAERRGLSPWLLAGIALALAVGVTAAVVGFDRSQTPEAFTGKRGMYVAEGGPLGALQFSYRARLSAADHAGLEGEPHGDAAMVLVQDRMNYHAFGRADAEDGADPQLGDVEALTLFGQVVGHALDAELAQEILRGTPLVEVEIYANGLAVELLAR